MAVTVPAASTAAPRTVDGACPSADGVTVVVDFGSAGGGIHTRCAPTPVDNGFAALQEAGFTITSVSSQPGFLCQIDAQPASTCQHVPQGQYWSYWHAPRGGAWTYSTSGASRRPPAGSVEGWSLGAGQAPGVAPPAAAPAPTTSTTHASPPLIAAPLAPSAIAPATTADPGLAPPSTPVAEGEGGPADTSTTSPPRTADDPEGHATPDEDADDGEVAGSPARRNDSGRGSPVGAMVGLGAAGILAAAGVVTARRRRTVEPAEA